MERPGVAPDAPGILIADASVLIDYLETDFAVLGLFSQHVRGVFVLGTLIREEVKGATEAHCTRVGLTIVEADTETLLLAAARSAKSPLSFYDWLCLLEAKNRSAGCLTSDGALIKACSREGIETRRGLSPLLDLVSAGHLAARVALALAKQMATKNPYLVRVLPEFEGALARLKKQE